MFLKSSFNYINEFYFIFKNQIRKIYLNSSIYNRKISRVDENILVYQPSLNILSSLIKYEKQKKKIEDFNVQSIWDNKYLKYNDFKKLHSFYWLFSIDLKSSNKITQSIIENWIKKNQNYEKRSWEIDILSKRVIAWISNSKITYNESHNSYKNKFNEIISKQVNHLVNEIDRSFNKVLAVEEREMKDFTEFQEDTASIDTKRERIRKQREKMGLGKKKSAPEKKEKDSPIRRAAKKAGMSRSDRKGLYNQNEVKEKKKIQDEEIANSVGGGGVAGLDIGLTHKKKKEDGDDLDDDLDDDIDVDALMDSIPVDDDEDREFDPMFDDIDDMEGKRRPLPSKYTPNAWAGATLFLLISLLLILTQ